MPRLLIECEAPDWQVSPELCTPAGPSARPTTSGVKEKPAGGTALALQEHFACAGPSARHSTREAKGNPAAVTALASGTVSWSKASSVGKTTPVPRALCLAALKPDFEDTDQWLVLTERCTLSKPPSMPPREDQVVSANGKTPVPHAVRIPAAANLEQAASVGRPDPRRRCGNPELLGETTSAARSKEALRVARVLVAAAIKRASNLEYPAEAQAPLESGTPASQPGSALDGDRTRLNGVPWPRCLDAPRPAAASDFEDPEQWQVSPRFYTLPTPLRLPQPQGRTPEPSSSAGVGARAPHAERFLAASQPRLVRDFEVPEQWQVLSELSMPLRPPNMPGQSERPSPAARSPSVAKLRAALIPRALSEWRSLDLCSLSPELRMLAMAIEPTHVK